jgi:hypothetical protein
VTTEHPVTDPEQNEPWDYERAERRPAVKGARAVVSVAFPREDFERVSQAAKRRALRTSEFIREAALEKAVGQPAALTSYTVSLGAAIFSERPIAEARTSSPVGVSGALSPRDYTTLATAPT